MMMTREEAIKILKGEAWICCAEKWNKALDMAIKSLEQEPKIGHWINAGYCYTGAYDSIDYVKCSCCHADSLEEGDYCPNCGAEMAEGV